MSFTKILESDKTGKKIIDLPDIPDLTADELKSRFDSFPNMIAEKHNRLIDELEAENAATNIGATAPYGITPSSNTMQEVVNAVAKEALKKQNTEEGKGLSTNDYSDEEKQKVDLNTQSRHSHSNKDVIDSITSAVKSAYDKIVALLSSITEVSDTVKNSSSSLPTGKAIVSYVTELGGGDMQKSVYDVDNDGVVDNSAKLGGNLPSVFQKVTDNTLSTTDKTVPGAINELFVMAQNGGKNLVGDEFSIYKAYAVGDYCIYENVLYKFTSGKEAGAWDESKVTLTTCAEEFKALNSKFVTRKFTVNGTIPTSAYYVTVDTDVSIDRYEAIGVIDLLYYHLTYDVVSNIKDKNTLRCNFMTANRSNASSQITAACVATVLYVKS